MLVTDSDIFERGEPMPAKPERVEEAYENLRMIREMMERSTKHSSFIWHFRDSSWYLGRDRRRANQVRDRARCCVQSDRCCR